MSDIPQRQCFIPDELLEATEEYLWLYDEETGLWSRHPPIDMGDTPVAVTRPMKSYEDFLALLPTADQLRDYHAELRQARLKGLFIGFMLGWSVLLILVALLWR